MTTGKELVATSRVRFAESDRSVRPGELMQIDRKGRVLTRRARVMLYSGIGVVGAVAAALPFAILTPAIAVCVSGSVLALVGVGVVTYFRLQPFIHARSRLVAGDFAGTDAILADAPRPARGVIAAHRAAVEGWLAAGRGNHVEAIARFEHGIANIKYDPITRLMLEVGLAGSHAHAGDVVRARAARAAMRIPKRHSELIELAIAGVDLDIAIAGGTELELDEAALDRWVRLALERDQTNMVIAALARVIAVRGDDALADHLAREAVDRFSWCPLASWPLLDDWIKSRLASAPPLDPAALD